MKNKEKDLGWLNEGFNFIDSFTVIDNRGTITAKQRFNPRFTDDENSRNNEWSIGKNLLEAFPSLNYTKSSLLQALTTGKVVCKEEQTVINREGQLTVTNNITFPIVSRGMILGAIELSKDVTHIEKNFDKKYNSKNKTETKTSGYARYSLDDIITKNSKMLAIKEMVEKIADSTSAVFVYGETGTGKELLVSAIHNASDRKDKPFLAINCAALPENILEGLLFGTQKGAFTGAENKKGMFEEANGGTVYLDEINSMPLGLQAKLLRVLQDKMVTPLGSSKPIKLDVRIITSTNKPLQELVETGLMREDILYRLNTIEIEIPPLRERREDIALLSEHFINKYNEEFGKNVKGINKEAMEFLLVHKWDGNVRELEHVIESSMNIVSDGGVIELQHIPAYLSAKDYIVNDAVAKTMLSYDENMPSLTDSLEAYEKKLIYDALVGSNYNISVTARRLKIPRTSLNYKIEKYGLRKNDRN